MMYTIGAEVGQKAWTFGQTDMVLLYRLIGELDGLAEQ